MRLAIFGGTGFLGYDFIKLIAEKPEIEFTVYSTSPKSLVNIARHEVDIRLIKVAHLSNLDLDTETDFVINFSHPFGLRDSLSPRDQIDLFVGFLERQRSRIPDLRLVHLSTMSVYEPFGSATYYSENMRPAPPKTDAYASDKVYVESRIKNLDDANEWQVHLRPTIVYGPYCRPWTDRIMQEICENGLVYKDLSGKIQPVYGGDISRIIYSSIFDFNFGTYNVAGDEELSWFEFFQFFEDIVAGKSLQKNSAAAPAEHGPSVGFMRFFLDNIKELLGVVSREESFIRMAAPVVRMLPRGLVVWVRDSIFGGEATGDDEPRVVSAFASNFYAEDRLVAMGDFKRSYPDFEFTTLSSTRQTMRNYYEYRFTDMPLL